MPYKDNLLELNNETNSSMLSSNLFLSKPLSMRNQISDISCFMKDANITYNTSNDTTKINSNGILNTSYQKTVYLSNETNNDSNCQTDANYYNNNNNLREIRVNMASKQRKNLFINSKNSKMISSEFNVNNFQAFNDGIFNDEDKIKKIIFIQQWWKTTYKVIYIQKCMRGFFSRKRITNLLYFIKCLIKLLFKLLINNIKQNINSKVKNNKLFKPNIANNNFKKINNNNQKFNKIGSNIKVNKNNNNKPNNNNSNGVTKNSFLSSLNKRVDELRTNKKKIKLDNNSKKLNNINNPINNNKVINQNQNVLNNTSDSKCFNKLKNKKITKDNKVKEANNISNKDKLTAYKNIYNIYNNVKKYYENDNNVNFCGGNYSTTNKFYPRNKKSSPISNSNALNNKKMKSKIMAKRGSMRNINEKIIINKNNNINLNININNPKTDRVHRYSRSPNVKDTDSILYLLKLKRAFIFWKTYLTKKKIVQKLKIMKNIKTPNNIKRTLPMYSNREPEKKSTSITTKKINLSNSLMNFKLGKITPKKLKQKNNNSSRKNYIFNNYIKKSHTHSNSVENNSMMNFKPQESDLNSTFENHNEINLKSHNNRNNNGFSNDLGNNSVIIISQYDRNNEVKKNNVEKSNNNNDEENDNKNKTKEKVYYFYAIVNLIDKHNKRKKTKKCFNLWKSYLRFSKSFINSKGIEEKIITFKTNKSPPKNTLYESRFNKNVILGQNSSSSNFNCQTESGHDTLFGNAKVNPILCSKDLLTPNPIEKSTHPNFFKSNYKQPKIVYQKKFLAPKKMRNQSMHIMNINDLEDERNNMTLMDNNKEINILSQTSGNTFYNTNTYVLNNNNNDLNKSVFLRKRNFENSAGKIHEGRLNKVNEIEETEIHFSPTSNHTQKINYEIGNNYFNGNTGSNDSKINVNVNLVQNFRRIDVKKEGIENNQNINNEKSRITTKQIILGEKRIKNNSQSKEVS